MFKNITINLSGPICTCEEKSLEWQITQDEDKRVGICIICKTCRTELNVPNKKFVAKFEFDTPYPGKPENKVAPDSKTQGKGVLFKLSDYRKDNE